MSIATFCKVKSGTVFYRHRRSTQAVDRICFAGFGRQHSGIGQSLSMLATLEKLLPDVSHDAVPARCVQGGRQARSGGLHEHWIQVHVAKEARDQVRRELDFFRIPVLPGLFEIKSKLSR